jgi:hypothetical protein
MYAARLDHRSSLERRQDPGESLGEHRLSRAGWSRHEEVVAAGGGHLDRPAADELAADI